MIKRTDETSQIEHCPMISMGRFMFNINQILNITSLISSAYLNVSLDEGFAHEGGTEKGSKRNANHAAHNPSKIIEWIWNLQENKDVSCFSEFHKIK